MLRPKEATATDEEDGAPKAIELKSRSRSSSGNTSTVSSGARI